MKRKLIVALAILFLISCIPPVCNRRETMRIINQTRDTILIGRANCNCIDSVFYFISLYGAKYDSTWTKKDSFGNLEISKNDFIPPDSIGCFEATSVFEPSLEHKGYFFIIKAETAKNCSWEEICEKKLYDTLVVQRKMMKDRSIKITGTVMK